MGTQSTSRQLLFILLVTTVSEAEKVWEGRDRQRVERERASH